jgi:hypothetical protein
MIGGLLQVSAGQAFVLAKFILKNTKIAKKAGGCMRL